MIGIDVLSRGRGHAMGDASLFIHHGRHRGLLGRRILEESIGLCLSLIILFN